MQCPRCNAEAPDQSLICSVCRKNLTVENAVPIRRMLTGEVVETSPALLEAEAAKKAAAEAPPPVLIKIHTANPALRSALVAAPPPAPPGEPVTGWRLALPYIALCGSLGAALLYCFPPHQPLTQQMLGAVRLQQTIQPPSLPPIFICIFAFYLVLSITIRRAMPAPWTLMQLIRHIPSSSSSVPGQGSALPYRVLTNLRMNWVLTSANLVCYLIFMGIQTAQGFMPMTQPRGYQPENAASQNFESVGPDLAQQAGNEADANQILRQNWRSQELLVYHGLALAAFICYSAAAGYAFWWLRARPDRQEAQDTNIMGMSAGWQGT